MQLGPWGPTKHIGGGVMKLRIAVVLTVAALTGFNSETAQAQAAQAPTVTVGGVGYLNYYYQLNVDSSLAPPAHGNNFDVARSYVNVLGKFAGGIGSRVTVDVDGRRAAANQQSIRLKYAFVTWTPEGSKLTYKLGMIQTPLLDWEESLWDYRMQGVMPLERAGYVTSSDFGAGIDGMWNYDGVNMQVGIYNGEGYSSALGDNRKDVSGRVSVRLARTDLPGKSGGLRLTGYANLGLANGGGVRNRALGILSYKSKLLTLAAEYGTMRDSTSVATPDVQGSLVAAYGVFNLPKTKAAIIGRVDSFDPNVDSTATTAGARVAVNRQTRVIAGVSYAMTPNLRVLLDADLNAIEDGSPTNNFDKGREAVFFHVEFKF
jgi:predicted RecA/RadA family phage recombinase